MTFYAPSFYHPTDSQIEQAAAKIRLIAEAADNSNSAGEVMVMKAAAAGDMYAALTLLVAEIDIFEERELDATCPDCTDGAVPNNFNKGPCPYHKAVRALNKADGRT